LRMWIDLVLKVGWIVAGQFVDVALLCGVVVSESSFPRKANVSFTDIAPIPTQGLEV
jgi:hypothetical protein